MTAFWQGQRVLVTGGTGLIGSWLVKDLLAAGAEVAVLVKDAEPHSELLRSGDSRRVMVVNGALEDYWTLEAALNRHEIQTVFHLGAQTIVGVANRSPLSTFEANIRGTYNLLEACRMHRTLVSRVIVASSDKAYGVHEQLPYTEDAPLQGRYPYDVSKTCTDLLAQSYWHAYRLPVAIARCGNVYGGGDLNWSRIVPGTVRSLLRGEQPVLRSDGTFRRDYIYVKDVSRAYMTLAERLEAPGVLGAAFNFSPGQPVTVLEIVAALQRVMARGDLRPVILNAASNEIPHQFLSSERAQSLLGWMPVYELEAGLHETVAWYREFLGASAGESAPPQSMVAVR
jgi:CDP-glucose 4,6-dehydratase